MFCDMRCEWGYWCYCNSSNCVKNMCSEVEISYEGAVLLVQCTYIM